MHNKQYLPIFLTLSYVCSLFRFANPPHKRELPRTSRRFDRTEPKREYFSTSIFVISYLLFVNSMKLNQTYSITKLIRSASGVSPSKLRANNHGCQLFVNYRNISVTIARIIQFQNRNQRCVNDMQHKLKKSHILFFR